ncbi:diacylglycerol kinase family protein [Bacillota bacterium Lsc_1132]
MDMVLHGDNKVKKSPLWKSISYAFAGIIAVAKNERNFQIHLAASVIAIVFSLYLSISKTEWLFILIAIGGVLSLELVNSAIERVIDLVTSEYHPLAKQAKDFAAGAVLVYAIMAAAVGLVIFLPKIVHLFL